MEKYLKFGATDVDAEKQWSQAVEQIHEYAHDRIVNAMLDGTTLHLLVVQIKVYKRIRAEEV